MTFGVTDKNFSSTPSQAGRDYTNVHRSELGSKGEQMITTDA
jgi:hypothetical protein